MPFFKTHFFSSLTVQGLALKGNDYFSNCIGVCMPEIFLILETGSKSRARSASWRNHITHSDSRE